MSDGMLYQSEGREGPQGNIKLLVDNDNIKFEDWVIEMKKMQVENVARGRARQEEIKHLWPQLQPTLDSGHEWIAHDWLTKWTDPDIDRVPPIDNEAVLCQHSKMDPHKITSFKCINANTAEILYSKYGGKPRLKSDMMCYACVTEQCRITRTKARIVEDQKFISDTLKICGNEGDFWVGKQSLRGWKKMALEEIDDEIDDKEKIEKEGSENGEKPKPEENKLETVKNEADSTDIHNDKSTEDVKEEDSTSEGAEQRLKNEAHSTDSQPSTVPPSQKLEKRFHNRPTFNEDLLCIEHNQLSTDLSCRRLVPASVWNKLKVYFPSAPEFPRDCKICNYCLNADQEVAEKVNVNRALALEQKTQLSDLYQKTRTPLTWGPNIKQLNVIPKEFLSAWRRFIRDPVNHDPVVSIGTPSLLCLHGKLPYQLDSIGVDDDQGCELIWPRQWEKLKTCIPTKEEGITIDRVQEDDGKVTFLSSPDVCEQCLEERIEEEFQSKLNYTSGTIFVRKITMDTLPGTLPPAFRSDSPTDSQVSVASSNDSGQDPEFIEVNGKRKKLTQNGGEKHAKIDIGGSTRRSNRHRKVRGEKEITVSSTQTLRDLKVQIMKHFSVAPFDQHLTLDGQEISAENDVTLSALRIIPGTVIYLKADEPQEDPIFLDDINTASYPEEGFKGTGLVGQ